MKNLKFLILILLVIGFISPADAQKPKKEEASSFQADLYKGLKWRNIGPFRGGRSNAVSGVINNDKVYYTGYTGGGVWKTDDAGMNWKNISDGFFKSGSVGDIAVSEADPNVIYVGMGEHAVRGVMTTYGDGVYKSTDAGETWTHIGLDMTRHISDVVIHPDNPDVVYVAAQGALHGPSEDRGVYRSIDGGKNWTKILYVDEQSGISSLSMDMNNPRILYAASWEHIRYPWQVSSGGEGSNLWKSTDGGENWEKINKGLPDFRGKMGISVSRADNSRVYAIVEAEKKKAGLYRSDDGGKSWKHMTSDQLLTARSWYYMEVFADPVNVDIVYVLNAPVMRSTDGGKNFSRVSVGHGDTHDLWINPANNTNMILGDDGGGEVTFNSGKTWSTLYNQPTAQFYRVNADKQFPYKVYGGQQDNSSVVIASRTNGSGITDKDWHSGPGCESAYIAFDPDNPDVLYGGCYQGLISALDLTTMENKDIMQYPSLNLAIEPKDMKYRFNWNAPIVASPHDPNLIYHAGNVVFTTTDGGMSWNQISPDLTRDDKEKQGAGGGPLTNEGAGGENYNTIYYLTESELQKGYILTGSDCGLVYLTKDGGKKWDNITPKDLEESNIHSIEWSAHDPKTAYIAANRMKFNDMSAMAYRTTNYGKSWTPINAGIDKEDFLRVIREDKEVPGLLYGGGERGFYVSYNNGDSWEKLQLNLPVVPITDMIIRDNDLVAATQGRAFWILDDLGAIQQSKGDFGNDKLALYQPKKTVLFSGGGGRSGGKVGQNPMSGVVFQYYLAEKPDSQEVKLEIMDMEGELIRAYSSKKDKTYKSYPGGPSAPKVIPAQKGVNRFAWDFRHTGPLDVKGVFIYGSYAGRPVGPGQYKARLSMDDQISEVSFEVVADPRLKVSATAYADRDEFFQKVDAEIEDIHKAVNRLTNIKKQINNYNELMGEMEDAKLLIDAGKELLKKIDSWEEKIVERRQKSIQDVINWPGKLNAEFFVLRSKLGSHDPRVTQGVKNRLKDLQAQWKFAKGKYMEMMEKDIAEYNQMFRDRNVPALITAGM
ncbi:MAG: glycosyl hydrolase [Bacteroidota bacterium]